MAPVFDGATTRRRQISLGGRKRDDAGASSREIIARAREERERRARERDESRCALNAQRVYRATRAVREAKRAAREAFDEDGEGCDFVLDANRARALVFFGDGGRDYVACARAAVDVSASGETLRDVFIDAGAWRRGKRTSGGDVMDVDDDDARAAAIERARSVLRMGKFTRLATRSLREATRRAREDDGEGREVARRAVVSLSNALVALMRRDDARWGDTGVELCAASFRDADDARCVGDILEDLRESEAFEDDVTRRAMRLLCENIARGGGGGALAWTLARVPRVWDAFGEASTTRELWEFVARRLETDTSGDASTCASSTLRGVDVALGNVIQPVKTHIERMTPRLACVVVRVATRLMSSAHSSAALFVASESDGGIEAQDDDDDDDDDDDVKLDVMNLRAARTEVRRAREVPAGTDANTTRDAPTFRQVREFFRDGACATRLMKVTLSESDADVFLQHATHVAAFAFTCDMVLTGSERETFLRLMTFDGACFDALWPALTRLRNVRDRGYRLLLGVYAKLYNMYTMISDDEEFYRLGKPIGLDATKTLVGMLRDALWELLWVERGPDGSPYEQMTPMDQYVDAETWHACSSALSRLHDRNGRHQFVDPLAFQARGEHVDIPSLLQEARDPKSRASMLLAGAPCLVPFEVRVHKFMDVRRRERQSGSVGYCTIRVRRGHLLEDGMNELSSRLTEMLGGIIRVQFINAQGLEEAGVDGGGLFKDFLNDLISESFNPKFGLFIETPERTLYPNPASAIHAGPRHLEYFYFLGAILGKACYDGILLDVPLAGFFLASLKGRHIEFNDLTTLDPELYRNLVSLKRYPGDVSDLCLYFTAIDRSGAEEREIQLIPRGDTVAVTNSNVPRYLHCMSIYLLRAQMYRQVSSMRAGFEIMMRKRWLNMFTPAELRLLISGNRAGSMDVDDMAANCDFSGGYDASHPTIRAFWSVMREITPDEQRQVLKFITSCSNTPLLGFSHLEPKLCIHRSGTAGTDAPDATADLSRLPTAATCMNLLKLPPYDSKASLKEKLMYAVKSGSGFDLS